jgi:hypothetical protein
MSFKNEIIIYQAYELTKVEVQIDNETVWLSQEQMAALFRRNRVAITQHIGNIFKEGELVKDVVCKEFLLTTQHGAIQDIVKNWFAYTKIEGFANKIVDKLKGGCYEEL